MHFCFNFVDDIVEKVTKRFEALRAIVWLRFDTDPCFLADKVLCCSSVSPSFLCFLGKTEMGGKTYEERHTLALENLEMLQVWALRRGQGHLNLYLTLV